MESSFDVACSVPLAEVVVAVRLHWAVGPPARSEHAKMKGLA